MIKSGIVAAVDVLMRRQFSPFLQSSVSTIRPEANTFASASYRDEQGSLLSHRGQSEQYQLWPQKTLSF